MTEERGYTVAELIIASAILLALVTSLSVLLHEGLTQTAVLEEATDLHQRARVAAEALAGDLRAAAAGGRHGPLSDHFAPIVPRLPGAPITSAERDVLTVRYVPPHGARSTLVEDLVPGASSVAIEASAGCPQNTSACGFAARTRAVVFDEHGHWDLVSIDGVGAGVLTISAVWGSRAVTYPAGTPIAEAVEVTYSLDAAARVLRRTQGRTGFPLVDHVVELGFEYFAVGFAALPPSLLVDGPFGGAGVTAFDVDLLRIRSIRAVVRLETGVDQLRGMDPRFFARPGTAHGTRVLPDLVATLDVGLRNNGR